MNVPLTIVPLFTVGVYVVQIFTGFFIDAELQVAILSGINIFFRMGTGRELLTGEIKPVVKKQLNGSEITLLRSRFYWIAIAVIVSAAIQVVAKRMFNADLDILHYAVPVLGSLGAVIGAVTKRPIKLA